MIDDPLSILLLEDDAADQQLVERELRKHVRQLSLTWVTSQPEYERALHSFPFDLILADFNLHGPDEFVATCSSLEGFPSRPDWTEVTT